MLTEYRTLQQEPLEQRLSNMSVPGTDGTGMPVDSSIDVNRILDLLTQDQAKLTQFKALLNMQPEMDKNKMLLDDYTFHRIEKFTGEA